MPFALPTGTIASEAGFNGVKQILITERLCEELHGAALHRLYSRRHVRVRCDEDDRHLPVRSSKVTPKLKTASPRHSHVEQTDENCWAGKPTVHNSRTTESRNLGSSSITKTPGLASPILGILRGKRIFPHSGVILRTISRDEQVSFA
jgi:hypothetical protein